VDWVELHSQLVSKNLEQRERATARPVVVMDDEASWLGDHDESRPTLEDWDDEARQRGQAATADHFVAAAPLAGAPGPGQRV